MDAEIPRNTALTYEQIAKLDAYLKDWFGDPQASTSGLIDFKRNAANFPIDQVKAYLVSRLEQLRIRQESWTDDAVANLLMAVEFYLTDKGALFDPELIYPFYSSEQYGPGVKARALIILALLKYPIPGAWATVDPEGGVFAAAIFRGIVNTEGFEAAGNWLCFHGNETWADDFLYLNYPGLLRTHPREATLLLGAYIESLKSRENGESRAQELDRLRKVLNIKARVGRVIDPKP